jgi:hypothetical protein
MHACQQLFHKMVTQNLTVFLLIISAARAEGGTLILLYFFGLFDSLSTSEIVRFGWLVAVRWAFFVLLQPFSTKARWAPRLNVGVTGLGWPLPGAPPVAAI